MRKNNAKPSKTKLVLKTLLVLFLIVNWIYMAVFVIINEFENRTDYFDTDAHHLNYCEKYCAEKQYDKLYDHMHLHKTYDEMYDVYWEVLDAYVDLQEYLKWKQVSEEDILDAREMEKYYYDKVLSASKNCAFPQNQKYLNDFAERLQ